MQHLIAFIELITTLIATGFAFLHLAMWKVGSGSADLSSPTDKKISEDWRWRIWASVLMGVIFLSIGFYITATACLALVAVLALAIAHVGRNEALRKARQAELESKY